MLEYVKSPPNYVRKAFFSSGGSVAQPSASRVQLGALTKQRLRGIFQWAVLFVREKMRVYIPKSPDYQALALARYFPYI